jgi:hypothetical protein
MDDKFTTLRDQQDADMNLYRLNKHVMMGRVSTKTPGKPVDGAVNITLNDPMVFGDAYLSIMQKDKCTREVNGIDESIQNKVEEDIENWLYLNDECLADEHSESLDSCMNFSTGFRGGICLLPLVKKEKDKYQVSILSNDPRWTTWELGSRGTKRYSYSVRMDKDQAEETFKKTLNGDKTLYLTCTWDEDSYTISNMSKDGKELDGISKVAHGLGFCPGVVVPVPKLPYMITTAQDASSELAFQWQSIYAPSRDTIYQMNDIASVLASMNKQQFLAPLVIATDKGLESFGTGEQFFGGASLIRFDPNDKFIEMPNKELKASLTFLYEKLWSSFERSLFSSSNMGQAGNREPALLHADLKSDRDNILDPRRENKITAMRKCFRNIARMINSTCYETKIDEDYAVDIDKKNYEKKFTVQIKYSSITPQERITNQELATRYKNNGYSDEYIMKYVTHEDHPSEIMRQNTNAKISQMVPQVLMYRALMANSDKDLTEKQIRDGEMAILKVALDKQLDLMVQNPQPITEGQVPSNPAPQPVGERPNAEKLSSAKLKQTGMQGLIEARRGQ